MENDSSISVVIPSRLKLPQLSPDLTERVFPIRSVVSVDSNPSSAAQTPSVEQDSPFGERSWSYPNSEGGSGSYIFSSPEDANCTSPSDGSAERSSSGTNVDSSVNEAAEVSMGILRDGLSRITTDSSDKKESSPGMPSSNTLRQSIQLQDTPAETASLTAIYERKNAWQNGPGEEGNHMNTDQSFGALLVLQESQGALAVRIASNNIKDMIGYSPQNLFQLDSLCDILPHERRNDFLNHSIFVRQEWYDVEKHGPEIFALSIYTENENLNDFWCTMHTTKANTGYILCELEPVRSTADQVNGDPEPGEIRLENDHIPDPPNALRILRKDEKNLDFINILNAMSRVVQLAANAQSLEMLFNSIIGTVKALTGFNRVTLYRLDTDWNGIALADAADPDVNLGPYSGMHIPGSIFSEGCRKLHLQNKVFLTYSDKQLPAELSYRSSEDSLAQLDMSHCYLCTRESSKSPANIATHASISISVSVFGKLWGLIFCQSYDKDMRLSPPLQKLCWLTSDVLSSNIERLSHTLPFRLQKQIDPTQTNSMGGDESPHGDILGFFGADYAASSILGETKILGKPLDSQEVLVLVEYLKMREFDTTLWSTDIKKDFQDLSYPPGFKFISSLIYIPLSDKNHDFIVFFKTSQWREVTWVGYNENLHEAYQGFSPISSPGRGTVSYKPDGWSAVDLGKASVVSLMYKTFSEIWQQKEAAMQNTQLMKLLLANCAHEVRTPLNAIINYLEIALDGSLNQETRESLARSHSASKSLIYIINDLLNLTNVEDGRSLQLTKDEVLNISETIHEATSIFREEVRQKGIELHIVQHSSLPLVLGDQRRVRQVITNLISNAVQNTSSGAVTVECSVFPDKLEPEKIAIEFAIHDTGSGMSQETVEALFCELEQVSNAENLQNSQCCQTKTDSENDSKSVLGLGLALVARMVRNMNGRLSVKSEKEQGSCFKIRLNFSLSPEQRSDERDSKQIRQDHSTNDLPDMEQAKKSNTEDESNKPEAHRSTKREADKHADENECTSGNTDPGINIAVDSGASQLNHQRSSSLEPSYTPPNGKGTEQAEDPPKSNLRILVAEDDPINSAIVKKRLEKLGYTVQLTRNGKECASVHCDDAGSFDAVLMDLQMPIVDGLGATRMIRESEKLAKTSLASENTCGNCRIPVFAVSASLLEKDRQTYIDAGFDGWILKPIDFQRINHLLNGVHQDELRNASVYEPGMWEKGGWFERREE
ncbi:hypothetical protein ASPWEDRAFT_121265 [Aspergillus wentii DTO 134E9]|uniref:Histidine kinase n=1 Tax=Aspergillus wentii DTO 134E9 TaxID=1073089 RepID=A0A1L9R5W3_ASPWE|nr:uncharacterized protein ASPWEDRAFT_121265 [Aspergillus wentii DTO 134E9]OJJ30278.1 hypothetical protein ASPWEDRAFT_121265 [Aspergillus wentii DTO 134E9]